MNIYTVMKPKILVVDDDSGICSTMEDILVEENYDVTVAYDGFNAIDKIKESSFSIALMDFRMPGINGLETFKKIKQIQPGIKGFIMTAYLDHELMIEAKKEGVLEVMFKPINIPNLLNSFIKCYNNHKHNNKKN